MTRARVALWAGLAAAGPSALLAARAVHHLRHGAPILAVLYVSLIPAIWLELPAVLVALLARLHHA